MGYFNKVMLLGNLTRDPELRVLPSDTKVTDFGLATNRKYRLHNGEEREDTLFIDCAAFGRNAELIHEFCKKGRQLLVEGHLKYDTWDDKQNGAKRSKISVVVDHFQFIGTRDDNTPPPSVSQGGRRESRQPSGGRRETPSPRREEQGDLLEENPRDEQIPF